MDDILKECLMTYGWVILIVIIVALSLYSIGVFNPEIYNSLENNWELNEDNILLCFRDSYMNSLESCTILTGDDTKGVQMIQADNETITFTHYLIDKKDNEIFIIPTHKQVDYEFTNRTKQETILRLKEGEA